VYDENKHLYICLSTSHLLLYFELRISEMMKFILSKVCLKLYFKSNVQQYRIAKAAIVLI